MDQMDVEGETDSLVKSVTDISLEFKFVTPYTSLFVEVPRNATKTTATTAIDAKAEAAAVPQSVVPAGTLADTQASYAGIAPATTRAAAATSTQTAGGSNQTEPGFEFVFAVIGLFVVKYLTVRMRK